MANVRLVARRAGVSATTVSRVLNNHPKVSDALRQRVIAATNEAGYTPTVGRRSTRNIALLYTGDSSVGSSFDAALMAGLVAGMEELGYDLMLLNARHARLPHETYTQMFVRKGVRGAVLRTTAATRGVCEQIAEEGFPAVVVADRFEQPNLSYVYSDSRESSREAVEHLIGLGHTRIAVCINTVDDSDHADRLAGYKQALAEHNVEFDRKLLLRIPANRGGGAQLMRRLLTMPDRPTAVFLTDPVTVVGALGEARRLGIEVPRDLSIVGFDDAELRYSVHPELTAVCQDAVAMAREAFKALHLILEQLDGNQSEFNGASGNGVSLSGATMNGAAANGASTNGAAANGASINGASTNGASSHPLAGSQETKHQAATQPAAPLVIKKAMRTWLEVHGSTAAPFVAGANNNPPGITAAGITSFGIAAGGLTPVAEAGTSGANASSERRE